MTTQSLAAATPFGYVPGAAGVSLLPADLTPYVNTNTAVTFTNNGKIVLAVNNGYSAAVTVTPVLARGVQGQTPAVPAYSLPAGKYQGFGPFPVADFGTAMTVTITAAGSGVSVALLEMTSA